MTNARKSNRGFTLIELLVALSIIAILIAFFLPAQRGSREASRRSQCRNNLKQIGLALHNYAERYGAFPPAYTVDADGNRLHSWRTLILPFIDEEALYQRIDLTKPWDDPANAEISDTRIDVYQCPSHEGTANHTTYLAVVGESNPFHPTKPRLFSEFTDGTDKTLQVIEAGSKQAVHWMSPLDADEAMLLEISPTTELAHSGGFQALLADGSVRFLQADTPEATRRALASIAGKDSIGEY